MYMYIVSMAPHCVILLSDIFHILIILLSLSVKLVHNDQKETHKNLKKSLQRDDIMKDAHTTVTSSHWRHDALETNARTCLSYAHFHSTDSVMCTV